MPAPAPAARQVPRALVSPPPTPGAAPYGLLSAATVGEGVDPHELNGIEYESLCSTDVREWPPGCAVAAGGTPTGYTQKQAADTSGMTAGDPFALYAAETCLLGNTDPDSNARLRQRFTLGEPAALEWTFFHGLLGNRPALKPDAEVLYDGGADGGLPVSQALGLLEHWLACVTGSTGMIHAPRWTAETLASAMLMGTSGPRAATKLGTTLVFGTGYPGTAPDAATTTTETWLYATTPVNVRRSNVLQPADWETGAADLDTNSGFRLVERMYVLDVPCHHIAAVRTTLPALTPQIPAAEAAGRHTTHITEEDA